MGFARVSVLTRQAPDSMLTQIIQHPSLNQEQTISVSVTALMEDFRMGFAINAALIKRYLGLTLVTALTLAQIKTGAGYYCYVDKAGQTVACWGSSAPRQNPKSGDGKVLTHFAQLSSEQGRAL